MVGVDNPDNDESQALENGAFLNDGEPPRRRRSQSVASAQPSVETVVDKAKRAASTLWTLLHAKNCVLADSCPNLGCREAKLLHLHLKTCHTGEGCTCPKSYHGCDQARKLLAHYRRCRNSRARQAGQFPANRRDPQQQSVCLICSLVARRARSILHERPSVPPSVSSVVTKRSSASGNKRIVSSFILESKNELMLPPPQPGGPKMPPPPPRSTLPVIQPENSDQHEQPAARSPLASTLDVRKQKFLNIQQGEDDVPEENDAVKGHGKSCSASPHRPRSASVGGTTLLFSSTIDSPCETIAEEQTEGDLPCQSFDFDADEYKC